MVFRHPHLLTTACVKIILQDLQGQTWASTGNAVLNTRYPTTCTVNGTDYKTLAKTTLAYLKDHYESVYNVANKVDTYITAIVPSPETYTTMETKMASISAKMTTLKATMDGFFNHTVVGNDSRL